MRYLILGAGKFGSLALTRLAAADPEARFVLVDPAPEALATAATPPGREVIRVTATAALFLAQHLNGEAPWDWIIPMAPEHVAYTWLMAAQPDNWETIAVPPEVERLAPVAERGVKGELYLSRSRHLCPDDCLESEVCPVTGESREPPLHAELAALDLPGWQLAVIPSLQLAPGVGGYAPGRLITIARDLAVCSSKVLLATACRCHGVVHALRAREKRTS